MMSINSKCYGVLIKFQTFDSFFSHYRCKKTDNEKHYALHEFFF